MCKFFEAPYSGWDKCLWITNDTVELVVTLEVGPRIIRYALKDGQNVLCEHEEDRGKTGGTQWRNYGGHRLWHSPEADPRSYPADNFPVTWTRSGDTVTLTPPPENYARTQKEISITLAEEGCAVTLEHRITNIGPWPIELAAWALTVLAPGGLEVLSEPTHHHALLPNRSMALWPYTKMNDPRLYWGEHFITIAQDPEALTPLKIGLTNDCGWAAYFVKGCLFQKRYPVLKGEKYPDFGMSFETYTNDFMLECETLSPLRLLEPEGTVTHMEHWTLAPCPSIPDPKDEEAIKVILNLNTI